MKCLTKIIVSFLCLSSVYANEEKFHDVAIHGYFLFPESEEYQKFLQSIPKREKESQSFEVWKDSLAKSGGAFFNLLESGKIRYGNWSSLVDDETASKDQVLTMLKAIQDSDLNAFVQFGSDAFKEEITIQNLLEVQEQMRSSSYDIICLGTILRSDHTELLWKWINLDNISEEKLIRLMMSQEGQVLGFLIQ